MKVLAPWLVAAASLVPLGGGLEASAPGSRLAELQLALAEEALRGDPSSLFSQVSASAAEPLRGGDALASAPGAIAIDDLPPVDVGAVELPPRFYLGLLASFALLVAAGVLWWSASRHGAGSS
ncbi:MAG TPA: hypothetical protein VMV46_01070 [Thermoanaerobaculia bacterium]|nr:hypothetical protein [Thermoanaerobaculia bacterium]